MVEPVTEALVAAAVGHIDVAFALLALEGASFGDMVAIFHRHLLPTGQRLEINLQPSCNDPAEVDEPRAVVLPCDAAGSERVDDAVSLEGLGRDHHVVDLEHGGAVPPGFHIGIQPLAAEAQRGPRTGVAVAAGCGLPGLVGGCKGCPATVNELADFGFEQGPVILRPEGRLAVPSLPDADEDFVLTLVQIGRDVLCHDERMPVEL